MHSSRSDYSQKQLIEKVNTRYCSTFKKIGHEGIGNSHFNHVAGNLLNNMFVMTGNVYDPESWESIRKGYLSHLGALRTYFRLMREFSDFRNKELTTNMAKGGYFPKPNYNELEKLLQPLPVESGAYTYVEYCARRLLKGEYFDPAVTVSPYT